MGKYGEDHHKTAFETYYRTRNWKDVERAIGCNYQTAFRWSTEDFKCPDSCPWHNWSELIAERDQALHVREELIESGNLCPVDHDAAMRHSVENPKAGKIKRGDILNLIHSDFERIVHLELLYNKVFYECTGLTLDSSAVSKIDPNANWEQVFEKGRGIRDLESGVRTLVSLVDQLDQVKQRAGLVRPDGSSANNDQEEERPLTLEDLRKVRKQIAESSPEQLEMLSALAQREDEDLKVLSEVAR